MDDAVAMDRALELARQAADAGEVPVGAVVVKDDRIIGQGRNEREATGDPTAHAEILALRDAARTLGTWRLDAATLYATLEPCPMCAGAAWAARIGRIVFGAPDPKAGATGSLYNFAVDERLNHTAEVTHGVGAGRSAELLGDFFSDRRD